MNNEQNTPGIEKTTVVSKLSDFITELLNQKQDEEAFIQAWEKLDEASRLVGEMPEILLLRKKLSDAQFAHRAYQKFEKTRQACESLWEQEQTLLKQNVSQSRILSEIFETASMLAHQAADEFPKSILLDGLKNDALFRYDKARERYQLKTTADQVGEYKRVFEKLEQLRAEGKGDELIPWNNSYGMAFPPITITDALLETLRSAQEFAYEKAQDYELQALHALEMKHSPREAREWLLKAANLWELPLENQSRIAHLLDEKVAPEIKRLEKAEEQLQLAQLYPDAEQGLTLIANALSIYPWVSGVAEVRQTVFLRLIQKIKFLLEQEEILLAGVVDESSSSMTVEALRLTEKLLSDPDCVKGGIETELQGCASRVVDFRTRRTEIFNRHQSAATECLAMLARGRKSLDAKDYSTSVDILTIAVKKSQDIPVKLLTVDEKADLIRFLGDAQAKYKAFEFLQSLINQVSTALRENQPCTSVDLLVNSEKAYIQHRDEFPELVEQLMDMKEKSTHACAERLAQEGHYEQAKNTLALASDNKKSEEVLKHILWARETDFRLRRAALKISLAAIQKTVNKWSLASLIASFLCLILLIAGCVFLLLGQVQQGIVVGLFSIIPPVVVKMFLDPTEKLRREQQELLSKSPQELDLEVSVIQAAK